MAVIALRLTGHQWKCDHVSSSLASSFQTASMAPSSSPLPPPPSLQRELDGKLHVMTYNIWNRNSADFYGGQPWDLRVEWLATNIKSMSSILHDRFMIYTNRYTHGE